jgi:hypothetical protein
MQLVPCWHQGVLLVLLPPWQEELLACCDTVVMAALLRCQKNETAVDDQIAVLLSIHSMTPQMAKRQHWRHTKPCMRG